jgi:hypothetical protein
VKLAAVFACVSGDVEACGSAFCGDQHGRWPLSIQEARPTASRIVAEKHVY